MTRYVIYFVIQLLRMMEFLFLARAILSWFPEGRDSKPAQILHMLTEPLIAPIRSLLNTLGLQQQLPIDISFFATFLILEVLITILSRLW